MPKPKPYRAPKRTPGVAADATVVPDRKLPGRKWFAAATGALVVSLLAGVGLDVGELGSSLADVVGIPGDPDSIEAATRTAIGALAAHYAWPEYLNLPEAGRRLVDRILGR